jgi:hypothetical protein
MNSLNVSEIELSLRMEDLTNLIEIHREDVMLPNGPKIQMRSSTQVIFRCFFLLVFALPMPLWADEIVGWGDNTYGKATPPDGNDYVAVSAGYVHSLALKSDGSIVAWGWTNYGLTTPPAGNDYIAIASGAYHSLALKSDGSIVGWGINEDGYGQGASPAGNSYKAIAAGYEHSLALKTDGSIMGWGRSNYGQATPPAGNDYSAISAGGYHSIALKSDGSIAAWGYDNEGEVSNVPAGNDYIAVSAGLYHNVALKSDGSIVCWGFDNSGRITPPAGNDYIAIAAGVSSSIALKSDGSIVAWGYLDYSPPAGNVFVAIAYGGHGLALEKKPYGGSGTLDDPYKIATKTDLLTMASCTGDYDKCFLLTNNIDLGGQIFTTAIISPGNSPDGYYKGTPFTGVFDGSDHKITNFTIDGGTTYYIGLFGFVSSGGQIKNLSVENANITGNYAVAALVSTIEVGSLTNCSADCTVAGIRYVGGLVGDSYKGTLTNCHAAGLVSGYASVGGLIANNNSGILTSCYSTASVIATSSSAGGLAGVNVGYSGAGTITNCYATGSVIGASYVGGLVGISNDTAIITNCHATGIITGTDSVGGLVGYNGNPTTITSCYAAGSVAGVANAGGLIGYNAYGLINSCYATGSATAAESAGGLMGWNHYGTLTSCYATGTVNATDKYAGGLLGCNESGNVTNCYATGSVSGNSTVGGLIGYDYNNDGTAANCFWDTQTSGTASSAGGAGKTTAEMKTLSTFTDAGWDFSASDGDPADWQMPNKKYPRLIWEQVPSIDYLPITVGKCSLGAGKDNLDSISIAGLFNAADSNFTAAMNGNVEVAIDSDTMASSMTFTFPINATTYKKGKFSGKITNTSFSFDTQKQKFTFAAKKTNLTGVACPITLTITIGGYAAQTQLEDAIVNGTKPAPFQLMMDVHNSLTVTKYKLKPGKVPGTYTDAFTAQGTFTIDGIFDITREFVITIGTKQSFTVAANSFVSKSTSFSCKNILTPEGGFVTAKLDKNKCTFTLSITKANIAQHGEVDFGLNCFGVSLEGLETIPLPQLP